MQHSDVEPIYNNQTLWEFCTVKLIEWFATLINGEIENVICNSENNGIN